MRKLQILLLFSIASTAALAQQASYFDPAQSYNRLLIEKNNGSYQRIGNYKVQGTSFLFGEKHKGHLYSATETAYNIFLSYNTYSQNVDFYSSANPNQPLAKEPGTLDSFLLLNSLETGMNGDRMFVYGPVLGSKDKSYFQLVSKGAKYSLYKKYVSKLAIVTTNYIDGTLRQFELEVEYYYTDSSGKNLKKFKTNPVGVEKEFPALKKVINDDALHYEKEKELVRLFAELNK